MEFDIKAMQKERQKILGEKSSGQKLEFSEAMEEIRLAVAEKKKRDLSRQEDDANIEKNKEYLRVLKKEQERYIREVVHEKGIRVRGYDNIETFIKEMVEESVGYSILSDAFDDPEVSDIFVIRWDLIFVEKAGKNMKYWKTFRDPKHFKSFLDKLLARGRKEINYGDSKIVDFEIYGDRGCAISKAVSPKDFSLTIRKHAEDHIKRDDIVKYEVMTEEMADFLGMLILGESNVIYAGLTGSGKTTTIRALLDFYVSKANKRMLVCEDTQELFPENEHTLELMSVKNDDKRLAVPLQNLIYTALRLKPKYIVVGEVRGEEAQSAVEAMETGHSTIFTMHGGIPWNIINRLVTKYLMAMPSLGIDVVERIIGSAVDYIAIQDNIPGVGRKMTILSEVSYNFDKGRVELKTIFRYDFKKKGFVLENKIDREKAEKMLRRGIPIEQLDDWVEGGL